MERFLAMARVSLKLSQCLGNWCEPSWAGDHAANRSVLGLPFKYGLLTSAGDMNWAAPVIHGLQADRGKVQFLGADPAGRAIDRHAVTALCCSAKDCVCGP